MYLAIYANHVCLFVCVFFFFPETRILNSKKKKKTIYAVWYLGCCQITFSCGIVLAQHSKQMVEESTHILFGKEYSFPFECFASFLMSIIVCHIY